jgi:excisionase family DNA binding protein
MTQNEGLLLTAKETAELLRISLGTLYHWVSQGRIQPTRFSSRCIRFRYVDLIDWIEAQETNHQRTRISSGKRHVVEHR